MKIGMDVGMAMGMMGGRAVAPWYKPAGFPDPFAVYKPIGAGSLAESYLDLMSTYNLSVVSAPALGVSGWEFTGTQRLQVNMPLDTTSNWSLLVLCRDVNRTAFRAYASDNVLQMGIYNSGAAGWVQARNGNKYAQNAASIYSGDWDVIGFRGLTAYVNTASFAISLDNLSAAGTRLEIGGTSAGAYALIGKIGAIILYNSAITEPQYLTMRLNMLALP